MKFRVRRARRGLLRRPQFYVRIEFANGKTFANSETYNNRLDVFEAIDRVIRNVAVAEIVDET